MLTPEWEWCSWLDLWEEETFTDIKFKSPIDSLDEDSLRLILLYLPIRDRVRCEGVCRRWRRVSRHIWKSEQKLCIEESGYCWWFPKNFLSVLLSKTGGLLRQLDFSRSDYEPCRRFGKLIASECQNLEELNLSSVYISNTHLRDMAEGLSQLKKFVMNRKYRGGNKGLDAILKANPWLEYLSLDGVTRVTSKGFFHISSKLKVLRISCSSNIWPRGLRIILKRNPGLEELKLHPTNASMFQMVIDSCRKLKTLSLTPGKYSLTPEIDNCENFACQRELEKLTLRDFLNLTDNAVRVIASTCLKLVEVDLKGCGIGNNSLKWLSYLPSLRRLNVSKNCVNDEGMKELATRTTISVFKAYGCDQITNEGVVALLESNPNMDTLDVRFARKVNDDLLPQLTRILSSRTSLDTLRLVIEGTFISQKAFESMDSKTKAVIHFDDQSQWGSNSDTDDSFNDSDLSCNYDADDCFNDADLLCEYDAFDCFNDACLSCGYDIDDYY